MKHFIMLTLHQSSAGFVTPQIKFHVLICKRLVSEIVDNEKALHKS